MNRLFRIYFYCYPYCIYSVVKVNHLYFCTYFISFVCLFVCLWVLYIVWLSLQTLPRRGPSTLFWGALILFTFVSCHILFTIFVCLQLYVEMCICDWDNGNRIGKMKRVKRMTTWVRPLNWFSWEQNASFMRALMQEISYVKPKRKYFLCSLSSWRRQS